MATEHSNISPSTLMTEKDIYKLDKALKSEDFRRLLCDYAREVNDESNRARYEREVAQMELERGFEVTFLHPTPGYVVKTANLRTDEKVFVNVCSEPNVDPPSSQVVQGAPGQGQGGVRWSIPYMQSDPRKDLDRAGRPCAVYDVLFHPDSLALASNGGNRMRSMLTETAIEAVEKSFKVKLGRENLRFPKMKVKGSFQRTVIRKLIGKTEQDEQREDEDEDEDEAIGASSHRKPKYVVKYRHSAGELPEWRDSARSGGRVSDPTRPTHVVVEVHLPDLTSTKDVDLDVTETGMKLSSGEGDEEGYSLSVPFSYPVSEEEATARFDVGTRTLAVSVPVKAAEVRRLTSTDSGIDVDTGYFACPEDEGNESFREEEGPKERAEGREGEGEDEDEGQELLFPPYSCNIYEDLMIFTLDVKRIEESSMSKSTLPGEPFGFSLMFSSMGKGMVPFKYGFHCALVLPQEGEEESLASRPSLDPAEQVEVEVWDNNVIVKVSLPKGLECEQYKVGSIAGDLTIHNLPQLRALRKKKEKKLKNNKPSSPPPPPSVHRNGEDDDNAFAEVPTATTVEDDLAECDKEKERHSSGDSEDSVLSGGSQSRQQRFQVTPAASAASANPSKKPYDPVVVLPDGSTLRSILKPRKQRCFSESQASELLRPPPPPTRAASDPGSSGASEASGAGSIVEEEEEEYEEEEEEAAISSACSKKSVRFDEVVQRKVFRPNSSITGMTAKNQRKKEQKRRRAERRASESDAEEAAAAKETDAPEEEEEDAHNDSGVASSMDEGGANANANFNAEKGQKERPRGKGGRGKRKNRKQQQRFLAEAANDLIFDLDM